MISTAPSFEPNPPERFLSLPTAPWLYRASRLQLVLLAVLVGLCVFGVAFAVDFSLAHLHLPVAFYSISDGISALAAALITFKLIKQTHERREAVRQRLYVVAEMNHHVRNAMEVISLNAYLTRDAEVIANIREANRRIEWALTEILGNGQPK